MGPGPQKIRILEHFGTSEITAELTFEPEGTTSESERESAPPLPQHRTAPEQPSDANVNRNMHMTSRCGKRFYQK